MRQRLEHTSATPFAGDCAHQLPCFPRRRRSTTCLLLGPHSDRCFLVSLQCCLGLERTCANASCGRDAVTVSWVSAARVARTRSFSHIRACQTKAIRSAEIDLTSRLGFHWKHTTETRLPFGGRRLWRLQYCWLRISASTTALGYVFQTLGSRSCTALNWSC